MSNNLVSQQMPIESVQMSQLEPISNKMDSSMHMGTMGAGVTVPAMQPMSMPNMQMGMMGPGSTDAPSRQVSVSGHREQPFEITPYNHLLQKLPVSNMQAGQIDQRACNMGPQQFLLPNKQLGGMDSMLNNVGSQQSSMLIKRKAPLEPTSNTPGLQKLSVPNKRVANMEHRPWLHQVSSPNKLPLQMQPQSTSNAPGSQRSQAQLKRSASTKPGTQQLSVQKNQSGQSSLKVQNESSDSVRSKLRESLAGALALVSQEQDKSSSVGKLSENAGTQENSQPSGRGTTADASNHISQENKESLPIKEDALVQKCVDGQNSSQEISFNNAGDCTRTSKVDRQNCQSTTVSRDEDISFSDGSFFKDELLQGNGLSWVLESDMGVAERREAEVVKKQPDQKDSCRVSGGQAIQTPEIVASKIEAELYKLFGGVNKKYKEKGRSLLFNLKDRNNPELRERVMSGEIAPERLCSMTAEELASKELSEWRMAKAEELAQMVVLPDSDVAMRRLVKKTHKGEFQVEVEPLDSISVEVAVGASSLTPTQPKSREKEASSTSVPDRKKDKRNASSEKNSSEEQVLMIPSSEGTDLMQGLMVDDELKDAEFLPPIVSLDEFMESLNSEPPFENLPGDSGKATPASDKDDSQAGLESKSPGATSKDPHDAKSGKPGTSDLSSAKSDADGISASKHAKSETIPSIDIPKGEHVWEGSLQLSMSALVSVISYYKSGERATPKGWPGLVDIKGRVRLDAFEKFLQELPLSRSRSVMAVHFVCKEGSAESDRASMKEVADSYVMDERVGFAEPVPGVELYFCPPHSKTKEMVGKVLPKDQFDALNAIDNGLIGVIVWRKPHVTSTISPKSASHHKHNSKKQHLTSRRHQEKDANLNVNVTSKQLSSHGGFSKTQPDDDDVDVDVPPGFGPPAGASRDEDDLPEFNFSSGSVTTRPPFPNQNAIQGQLPPNSQTLPRPVDQMRELVHRYGQPNTGPSPGSLQDKRGVGVMGQPWNEDDDDMPEWHPDDAKPQPQPHSVHMHTNNIPPPMLRPHVMQQTPYQQMVPQAQALPLQTQVNASPSWPQGQWAVPNSASQGIPAFQPNYGMGQQGVTWRRDAPTSRGF